MSSYGLLARLSNVENDTSDLQASLNSLDAEKQDSLSNANVVGGQPIKVGSILNKIGTKDTTLTVETEGSIINLAVDKTVMQEKLTATADAANSKAVLSNTTVRSVGADETLSVTETNNVIKLAVDKEKIQEKLTVGSIAGHASVSSILSGNKIKGIKGLQGISAATNDADLVWLYGPQISNWSSGPTSQSHYIDTGPIELQIRGTNDESVVEFYPSKAIHTNGPVTMEKKLTVNKNVETRKLLGDEESGILQVPTVKANEVVPIAPATRVKITQLESNIITLSNLHGEPERV